MSDKAAQGRIAAFSASRSPAASYRNSRIDLLRGIAILLVVLDHLAQRIPPEKGLLGAVLPKRVIDGFVTHGYEAVFIFFVISGFLITSNALTWWHRLDRINLKAFYARRFSRIVPCLVALVCVLSVLHLFKVRNYVIDQPGQSLPGAISAALGIYLNWYEGYTGHYLPGAWDVLWSLSIEEVFYLGFPLACLIIKRQWLLALVLVLLAVSLPWARASALATGEIWQEKAYLPGMAAIAAGVLTALAAFRVRLSRPFYAHLLTIFGAVGIGAVLFADDIVWRVFHQAELLLLTISSALLILAFDWRMRSGSNTTPPGTAWLCVFGRLSYEVYLTHMFVVFGAVALFNAVGGSLALGIFWFPPAVALAWLLGVVIDKVISTPCNVALRKRLITRYAARSGSRDCADD